MQVSTLQQQEENRLSTSLCSSSPNPNITRPSCSIGPENFEKIRILGAGSTGRVYLVKSKNLHPDHSEEEEFFAMKVVRKSELVKKNRIQHILTEKQILACASHPFVVTLHYSFQTEKYFYLVMQYCAGGEFFSFLKRQQNNRLTEDQAKFYASEVLLALEYLHLIGIIYRDLKPENILVHESGHIMLSDFDLAREQTNSLPGITGYNHSSENNLVWFRLSEKRRRRQHRTLPRRRHSISGICCPMMMMMMGNATSYPFMDTETHLEEGEKRMSFVGTHEYVAPEIIAEEGYVGSVDWWAFGILLYEMIYATTPFKGSTQIQTLENILDLTEEIEFPSTVKVTEACKDFIRKLLAKDVNKRLQNPIQIKAHPFFKGINFALIRNQTPPIVPTMVHSLDEKQHLFALDFEDSEVPYLEGIGPRRSTHSAPSSPVKSPTKQAAVKRTASLHSLEKTTTTNHPHHHHANHHHHPHHAQDQPSAVHLSSPELPMVRPGNNPSLAQVTPELTLPVASTSTTSGTAVTYEEEQEDKTWDVKHNTGGHELGPHVARVSSSSLRSIDSSSTYVSSYAATGGGGGGRSPSLGGGGGGLGAGDQSSSSVSEQPMTWHEKDLQWVVENFEYTKAPTKRGFWESNASSRSLKEKISSLHGSEIELQLTSADASKEDQDPVSSSTSKEYTPYIQAPELAETTAFLTLNGVSLAVVPQEE